MCLVLGVVGDYVGGYQRGCQRGCQRVSENTRNIFRYKTIDVPVQIDSCQFFRQLNIYKLGSQT